MQSIIQFFRDQRYKLLVASLVLALFSSVLVGQVYADNGDKARDGRLITVHDRGSERVILTNAVSVREALKEADIPVAQQDVVEPKLDSELIAAIKLWRQRK